MPASSSTLIRTDAAPDEASAFGIASTLLPIRLVLLWGEALAGAVFLRQTSSPLHGPETLGDRLNEPESAFLPIAVGGRVEVVRLGAVAYVEHRAELPEIDRLRELGAAAEPVAIELMTGETLEGKLLALAPPERSRLSDILNRGETFVPLAAPGRTLYVNRDAIARARGRR